MIRLGPVCDRVLGRPDRRQTEWIVGSTKGREREKLKATRGTRYPGSTLMIVYINRLLAKISITERCYVRRPARPKPVGSVNRVFWSSTRWPRGGLDE